MPSHVLLDFSWWVLALQLGAAIVISAFAAAALLSLSLGRSVLRPRFLVAEGVIGGLGLMTAAALPDYAPGDSHEYWDRQRVLTGRV